jgi:hypothetical protein
MEGDEQKVLGHEGSEKSVAQMAAIEKQLGIYDLAQFTPKVQLPPHPCGRGQGVFLYGISHEVVGVSVFYLMGNNEQVPCGCRGKLSVL